MSREDSAVRKLDELFAQEAKAQGIFLETEKNRTINATREQVDIIVRFFQYNPQYTRELNIILETGTSAEGIINNMEAFVHPDGESEMELGEFEKKVLGFRNLEEIRQMVERNIGIRSVGAKDIR
jgi:hypothetical protein